MQRHSYNKGSANFRLQCTTVCVPGLLLSPAPPQPHQPSQTWREGWPPGPGRNRWSASSHALRSCRSSCPRCSAKWDCISCQIPEGNTQGEKKKPKTTSMQTKNEQLYKWGKRTSSFQGLKKGVLQRKQPQQGNVDESLCRKPGRRVRQSVSEQGC